MLRDFVEKKHCIFFEEAEDWRDALRKSCIPLVQDGTVEPCYGDEVVRCVEKYGPYIVLMPGVAMPHSQEGGEMVHKTCISFMKLQKPVIFDETDQDSCADLFFTLASCNPEEHLEDMQELSELLEDEELVRKLHEVRGEEDLLRLADQYDR